jgi:ubiquinone/menaquinone biosynthesis C-methylase UbiE
MYRDFRPQYTREIVEYVVSQVATDHRTTYVDIACGSGQLTKLIAPYFENVIGIDRSFEQLRAASPGEDKKIEWKPGSAFALPLPDNSVDLVTVAQGLHWLTPYDEFFGEVDRVLRPGGIFCAVGYAFPQIVDNPTVSAIVDRFYIDLLGARKHPGEPGTWWETNRMTIDGFYQDITFPYSHKETKKFDTIKSLSVDNYLKYLQTLSAYRTMLRAGQPDPIPLMESGIFKALNSGEDIVIRIPFFTVLIKKPPSNGGSD